MYVAFISQSTVGGETYLKCGEKIDQCLAHPMHVLPHSKIETTFRIFFTSVKIRRGMGEIFESNLIFAALYIRNESTHLKYESQVGFLSDKYISGLCFRGNFVASSSQRAKGYDLYQLWVGVMSIICIFWIRCFISKLQCLEDQI